VRETAAALGVPLIDLHRKSQALIERHGVEGSKILFLWIDPGHFKTLPEGKKDDTHFSSYGAAQVAALVAEGVRELNLPLGKHLLRSAFTGKYEYELPKVYRPHFRQAVFPVTAYGAKPDGLTPNTAAFNAAIEACHKAGGGAVMVPRGVWLTGPIVLRSNVNLHLERGALVTFSGDRNDYPLTATSFEGVGAYRAQSPISADGAENVGITGEGIFDGAGDRWRPVKRSKMTEGEWKRLTQSGGAVNKAGDTWYPSAGALKGSLTSQPGRVAPGRSEKDYEDIRDFLRPNMVQFVRSRNVLIEGVTFQNSPAWTLHLMLDEHVTLSGVKVKNPWHGQNTDGVDLDSTRNVLIEGCVIDTGDDAICLKSGRDEEGRRRGVPTENVLVRDCTVYHGHGGFVVGSEMSGGVRNVFVSDTTFIGTDIGLRFKTTRGRGGVVEQVYAANLQMKDIADAAVFFDMYYGGQPANDAAQTPPATEATPQFRDFFIRDIVCRGAKRAVFVRGLPEMAVRGLRMENFVVQSEEGVHLEEAEDVALTNVAVYTEKTSPVVTVRNASRISLDRFDFTKGAELLVLLAGGRTKEIALPGTEVSQARAGFRFTEGASPSALR
jgi:DNA sulfur modification protein DndE